MSRCFMNCLTRDHGAGADSLRHRPPESSASRSGSCTMSISSHGRGQVSDDAGQNFSHALDPLEPRVHLAAYTFESFADLYGLASPIRDVAPPSGVTVVGFGSGATGVGDLDGDGKGDF